MLTNALEVFAQSIGLKSTENFIYGIYQSYFLSVSEEKEKRIVTLSAYLGDSEENSLLYLNLSDGIKAELAHFCISDYELTPENVQIVTTADLSLMREMIDAMIALLQNNQIAGTAVCPRCGITYPPADRRKIAIQGKNVQILCDNCALETVEENQQLSQESETVVLDKTLPGFFGALIGGIVGLALMVASYFILPADPSNILAFSGCLIAFLIGAFAYLGYSLLCKRFAKAGTVIISTITVLFSLLGAYAGSVILFARKYGSSFELVKKTLLSHLKIQFSFEPMRNYLIISAGAALLCAIVALIVFLAFYFKKSQKKRTPEKLSITTYKI